MSAWLFSFDHHRNAELILTLVLLLCWYIGEMNPHVSQKFLLLTQNLAAPERLRFGGDT